MDDGAAPSAAPTSTPAFDPASVRDLEALTLAAPHVDAPRLLAIIQELRQTAGVKLVNNAITTVMRKDPNAPPSAPKQHEKVKKPKPTKKSRGRAFVMSNYRTRALVVKFLYIGERFAGFARQDHMEETVERYVIDALERTKLIAGDIEQAGYSRCGRTDRGVSAFGQVIAVTVRSNLPVNAELVDHASLDAVRPGATFRIRLPSGDLKTISEVDYPTHINRALPPDIRVYSVVAAPTPNFSARFDCTARMYRYFFLKNDLDIDRMRAAAQLLVGKHDYRNFCRIDTNVNTFERRVMSFDIVACTDQVAADPRQQMYRCEVRGRAFLWHQVRCMVQVLFLVASGKEEPALIAQLLDVAQTPRKPQYDMAPDAPLVLHDCFFDNVQFDYSPLALHQVHDQLTRMWEQHCIQGAILRSNLDTIGEFPVTFEHVTSELDHYAPTLGQLLTQQGRGGGAGVVEANGDDDGKATLPPVTFAWKHVLPLLPIASRRRNIPLLTRDTGDSVDEKKNKIQARKRRRREVEEEEAAGADSVQTSALMDTKNSSSSSTNTSISEAAEEKRAALQEGDVIVDGDVITDSLTSSMSERGTAA